MSERGGSFNIKAVIQETGLNAETLRAWERRYGLPSPVRSAGGQRLYTMHDIRMLNWLSARQKEGLSISRAVELWRSLETNDQDPLQAYSPSQAAVSTNGERLVELRQAWVDACLNFDEQTAEQVLAQAFAVFAPELVCLDLLMAGLSMIGDTWYEGKTSIQQEHFASALAMRRLHTLLAAAPAPILPGRIMAACPAGEEHEFGLLLLTVLLRRSGWEVVYLGANVPIIQLESALKAAGPFLVISVIQTLPTAASLRKMGEFLAGNGVHLAYSGGVVSAQPELQNLIPGHYLGVDFQNAVQSVNRVWNLRLPIPEFPAVALSYQQALQTLQNIYPHIVLEVSDAIRAENISPAHLDIAITALHRHLEAALELGEIRLVSSSLDWLEGLLVKHGISKELLKRFLFVYQQALQNHIPASDREIFASLIDLFKEYA